MTQQERVVQQKVIDMVGTFTINQISELEAAIDEVKAKKGWDVKDRKSVV